MKLSAMSKADLEQLSYIELTKKILEESEPLNTLEIFNKIYELLGLNKDTLTDKIGDYYTSLATDKSFILLSDGKWDLQKNHPAAISLEDEEIEDEEELESIEEMNDEMEEMAPDDIDDMDDVADLDDDIEDDDELTIIPEDELDDESM